MITCDQHFNYIDSLWQIHIRRLLVIRTYGWWRPCSDKYSRFPDYLIHCSGTILDDQLDLSPSRSCITSQRSVFIDTV